MEFSESGQKTLAKAKEEALRLNHHYIGTEHLLLGLLGAEDTPAAQVLKNMGIQLPKLRSAVEFISGRGAGYGNPELTTRSMRVIELAMQEARKLDSPVVHSEHILLGLVQEGEGIGAGVLESLGVRRENIRPQVMRAMASGLELSEKEIRELEEVVANLTLFEQLIALNLPGVFVPILNAHVSWEPERLTIVGTQPETFEILQSMLRLAVQPFRSTNHVCLDFASLHRIAAVDIIPENVQDCPFCSMMINAIKQAHMSRQTS
jgi:hypothetical protein